MNNDLKWDKRFLKLAKEISTWSKDPSKKVGSIIVGDRNRIVSVGYNGFPRGVLDEEERLLNREVKYKFMSHAERNALDNCEESVNGFTLYSTLFPCNECAKSIIQKGINRVVTYPKDMSYYDKFGWKYTEEMFKEKGIVVCIVEDE